MRWGVCRSFCRLHFLKVTPTIFSCVFLDFSMLPGIHTGVGIQLMNLHLHLHGTVP